MKQNIKAIFAPMSPKEKMEYIWTYCKFHIIGTIAGIILLISFEVVWVRKKKLS